MTLEIYKLERELERKKAEARQANQDARRATAAIMLRNAAENSDDGRLILNARFWAQWASDNSCPQIVTDGLTVGVVDDTTGAARMPYDDFVALFRKGLDAYLGGVTRVRANVAPATIDDLRDACRHSILAGKSCHECSAHNTDAG